MKAKTVELKSISSWHLGGKTVILKNQPKLELRVAGDGMTREVDLNGTYITEQIYAQEFKLANPITTTPVLLWHGGAMTGVTWESTPDERPGWQWRLLESGFNVVTSDAVERGRSSWSPYPQIYKTEPIFRTKEEVWKIFRFGSHLNYDKKIPYEKQRFPIEYIDKLCAQIVPRWTTHDQLALNGYLTLLKKTGPAIVIAHSQGGWLALNLVHRHYDLFKAIILIEPGGAPTLTVNEVQNAIKVPHFVLWCDYINDVEIWQKYKSPVDNYFLQLKNAGGVADEIDLPAQGVYGNSHLPMMDNNSDQLIAMIVNWIKKQSLN